MVQKIRKKERIQASYLTGRTQQQIYSQLTNHITVKPHYSKTTIQYNYQATKEEKTHK